MMARKKSAFATPGLLLKTLREILAVPTVPFGEQWLAASVVRRFRRRRSVRTEVDALGNVCLRYRPPGRRVAKFAFQAHLDHPGFRCRRSLPCGGEIEVLGHVPAKIKRGKLRFFTAPGAPGIPATISRDEKSDGRRVLQVKAAEPIPAGSVGMWDFPPLRRDGDYIEGRGFDDNLGVAILVYLLEEAARRRFRQPFDVLFTRAEETGCVGAMEMLRLKTLRLPPHIITLEMPGARGEIVAGDGVIVRVGDRFSVFDPVLSLYLYALAWNCGQDDPGFSYQRRLVGGGGTEVTPFSLHGYQASALCLATINQHNRGPRERPAPERVHLGDLLSLLTLLRVMIAEPFAPAKVKRRLRQFLEQRISGQRQRLRGRKQVRK